MRFQLDLTKEYGIVLEGGGARGSYQIGAWKALREAGIKIRGIAGASVGALNGALICMDDLEKAEEIWENIRYSQVIDVDDDVIETVKKLDLKSLDLVKVAEDAKGNTRQDGEDEGRQEKDRCALDAEGGPHGQVLHQGRRHRGQDDGRNAAARGADAQGQGPVPVEPAVHQERDGDHRAEPVAQARHRRAHAEEGIGLSAGVEQVGQARAAGGDAHAQTKRYLLVVPANGQHGQKRREAPQGDEGGRLGVGQAALVHDVGQVDGKAVGHRAHGDEEQERASDADHPTVMHVFHWGVIISFTVFFRFFAAAGMSSWA